MLTFCKNIFDSSIFALLISLYQSGDAVFLKHVREVKEHAEDGPPATKITRLAIGVEGGFDGGKDQFEYEVRYKIICRTQYN